MLHIITPLYRFHLLEKVYQSIPKNDDIRWHIAKSTQREKLEYDFIQTDSRIHLYELDCPDADTVTKRNVIFANIKDGFFYCLDDDTLFLEEVYNVYKEYHHTDFKGMIIGQSNLIKKVQLSADPKKSWIDTGMVICYFSVLEREKWEWTEIAGRDCYFWSRCYQFFGEENIIFLDKVISHYNSLSPYLRVRKPILFWNFKYDIYNRTLARTYIKLALTKNIFYKFFFSSNNTIKEQKINHLKALLDAFSK
ncbi:MULTISPECIES: hypothetical protein [Emticicia]|uniref:hypothetical protein n=1 Tax=Emticicia TaxID=312278 RepID=UPI0007D8B88A|nr:MULTISPECIES: hypothetical protein [Emticicia]